MGLKKAAESPEWTSSLTDQTNIFLAISGTNFWNCFGNNKFLGALPRVRKYLSPAKISQSRLAAPWYPRMHLPPQDEEMKSHSAK